MQWRRIASGLSLSVLALMFVVGGPVLAQGKSPAKATKKMTHSAKLPLDGRTFTGTMGDLGQKKGNHASLKFRKGMFCPFVHTWHPFKMASYTATAQGDSTVFESETLTHSGDKMDWRGVVKGDAITATGVLKNKTGKALHTYWVTGEKRMAKKKAAITSTKKSKTAQK